MGGGLGKVAQEIRCRARRCGAQLACSLLTLRRPVATRDKMHVPIHGCREINTGRTAWETAGGIRKGQQWLDAAAELAVR